MEITRKNFFLKQEVKNILSGVWKGIVEIPFPPKKLAWCKCGKCDRWHKTG